MRKRRVIRTLVGSRQDSHRVPRPRFGRSTTPIPWPGLFCLTRVGGDKEKKATSQLELVPSAQSGARSSFGHTFAFCATSCPRCVSPIIGDGSAAFFRCSVGEGGHASDLSPFFSTLPATSARSFLSPVPPPYPLSFPVSPHSIILQNPTSLSPSSTLPYCPFPFFFFFSNSPNRFSSSSPCFLL